jgi:regulator of RNase E activity RraA
MQDYGNSKKFEIDQLKKSMHGGIEIYDRRESFKPGCDALAGIPTSVIGDVMGRMIGSTGLSPINRSPVAVCGNAVTVSVRGGDNLLIHKALNMLEPGDILVIDGAGDVSRALVGEIIMTLARMRRAAGFVVDGAVRDVDAFERHHFPCWARAINLRGPYKHGPGTINKPVCVGGLLVYPGDVVVADSDGVIAVSPNHSIEVALMAKDTLSKEQMMINSILSGSYSSAWVDVILNQKNR